MSQSALYFVYGSFMTSLATFGEFGELFLKSYLLEGTARYACLLLAPAEGFGLRAKKDLLTLLVPILGHVWCSVVTSVTLSNIFRFLDHFWFFWICFGFLRFFWIFLDF